ncbi:sulfurtransferase [Pseudomonas fragi]|uniref:3-mercaptopyruvate sulfurtransferase n=1 Tax=Pseudomonas fragi TaxID=296 RepID=A0A449ISC0_PSEFR|nr:sulfurtransferase [Pseudomonas fragi]VFB22318.1 3-mercaptopyruvate sulfurtransferase [Pseudomonas fragi]
MNSIMLRDPNALVSTRWLEEHLGDPGLRIFDCTTRLVADEGGKRPYIATPCLHEYEVGHIPGAGYFDLQKDFSRQDSPYGMTLADPAHIVAAFEKSGIDNSSRVVLYCRRGVSWSARFWWMLKWLGFDNASILDGGHEKWEAEKRALSASPCKYPAGTLQIQPRPELFVGKAEVLSAINDPSMCTISALGADVHNGKVTAFRRPGRIPRSVNVPQKELLDPETGLFKTPEEISRYFIEAQTSKSKGFITYCGSGIFAAVDAFWLYQLGYDNVAVYDNSMSEWGADATLPMECDFETST